MFKLYGLIVSDRETSSERYTFCKEFRNEMVRCLVWRTMGMLLKICEDKVAEQYPLDRNLGGVNSQLKKYRVHTLTLVPNFECESYKILVKITSLSHIKILKVLVLRISHFSNTDQSKNLTCMAVTAMSHKDLNTRCRSVSISVKNCNLLLDTSCSDT